MLRSLQTDDFQRLAEDIYPTNLKNWEKQEFQSLPGQHAGYFNCTLNVKTGSRIMLIQNLDVSDGLMMPINKNNTAIKTNSISWKVYLSCLITGTLASKQCKGPRPQNCLLKNTMRY